MLVMNDARDANRAYWDDLTRDLPLRRGIKAFEERVLQLALGREPRSQMIIAPPGCEIGTRLDLAVKKVGGRPVHIGEASSSAMLWHLMECARSKVVGIIDNKDTLFADLARLHQIDVALEEKKDEYNLTGAAAKRSRFPIINFKPSKLAIISDIDVLNSKIVGKKVADYWRKLTRKIDVKYLDATDEERYQFTCHQIICEHKLRRDNVHTSILNEMLKCYAEIVIAYLIRHFAV